MRIKPKRGQHVLVYWHDASDNDSGWGEAHEKVPADTLMVTSGFFVRYNKGFMLGSSTKDLTDFKYTGDWQIPRGCIVKICDKEEQDGSK